MTEGSGVASETEDQSTGLFSNLPIILWQRRWFVVLPAVLVSLSALAAAFLLPRAYVSSATLLVESQNLPGSTTSGPADTVIDRRIAKGGALVNAR
jgi:succinoglycan biosynthesis transport protein ExoP